MGKNYDRRTFIKFLGKGTMGVALMPAIIYRCDDDKNGDEDKEMTGLLPFTPISPTEMDDLVLADGFEYEVLIRWEDKISDSDYFGFNNDFTQFMPLDNAWKEGLLWVNHEYLDLQFVSDSERGTKRDAATIEREMYNVGGTFVKVKKKGKHWQVVKNDPLNRRVSGLTKIPFNWDEPIGGRDFAMGTLANCSGGYTPWGTILTAEENYDSFYGEYVYEDGREDFIPSGLGWETHFPENNTKHYGWIVEIDPQTGDAKKHIALGRCCHECAKVYELEDGRVVIYTGDDGSDRCLYKFIGSKPGTIDEGTLYVADLENGQWVPLDHDQHDILRENFEDQTEVLVRMRESAPMIGGTPLDRPEDIEVDPVTGAVLIALTNNTGKDNYFGSILRIDEQEGYDGLSFEHSTFLAGGEETGFACPDNLAFDPRGNLWFTSDISGSRMQQGPYASFKNNGLYFVPRSGERAGEVFQVASAPTDAEFTGPCFTPDGSTLFLSVQHPGEYSESLDNLSSHWPDGSDNIPRPSVVTISGEALDKIMRMGV